MPCANRVLGLALVGLGLSPLAHPASAADWRIGGTFSQSIAGSQPFGGDRDNGGLSATTSLGIAATARTPRTTFTLAPSLGVSVSERDTGSDGDTVRFTPSLRASLDHRAPRTTLTGSLSVVPQFRSAREFDLVLQFDPETGLPEAVPIARDVDPLQITVNASAGMTHSLGPRDRVNASVSAQAVEYVDTVAGLSSTRNYGVTLGWSRDLTPRTAGSLTGSVRRFDTDSPTQSGRTAFTLTPGLSHALTPRHRLGAGIGLRYVEGDNSDLGVDGNASLSYRATETSVTLAVSQGLRQDDDGALETVSRLSLTASRRLTPRWSGSLSTSLSNAVPLDGGRDRQTFSIGPSLSYALTPRWSVRGSYALILERFDGENTGNNRASLQLSRTFDF